MRKFYKQKPPKVQVIKPSDMIYKTSAELYEIAKERKIKHQYKIKGDSIIYINDDPVLSLNWHFYKTRLIKNKKGHLIKKYNLNSIMFDFDKLKELIVSVFASGSEDYEFIMGLDTLWGWKDLAEEDVIVEKITGWVNNDFKPKIDGSEETFNTKFRDKVRKVLRWKSGKLRQNVTAEDFVTNIASTGTSGSAFDHDKNKIDVSYNGERVKFTNNKYAKSAYLSAAHKKERLFKHKRQRANVSQKVEFWPKLRVIVSSDFDTTMKMRFVDTWLREWMRGNDLSTLWQDKRQSFDMWVEMAKNKKGYNVPIDQSAFDHHVTKAMVTIMLEEIKGLIGDRATNNDELLLVMDAILYALDGGEVIYKGKNTTHKWEYKSGILSGWQWTAFLDTLANLAENLMAQDIVTDLGVEVEVYRMNAQGDDDLLRVNTPAVAFGILAAMRSMGFEIHKYKSFISSKHNEYLRRYAKDGKVNGYPARMVNNLLWLYPGDRYQKSVLSRLSAAKDKWVKFYERMKGDKNNMLHDLRNDYKGMKIDKNVYEKYLSTKRTYGGAGLVEGDANYIIEEYDDEDVKKGGFMVDKDKGYQDFRLRYGEHQTREMEQWLIKSIDVVDPTDEEMKIAIKKQEPLSPYRYSFIPTSKKPTTSLLSTLTPNVIFGKSREFMEYAFPNINTFHMMGRAPKSWIYDYLTNRLKPVTPKILTMSDEFSSMLYDEYEASIINAMYYKKTVPDKWVKLNLFAEEFFPQYVYHKMPTLPEMY